MRRVTPTVEGAFFAALTVILYLGSIYIPVFGLVLSFLCPLPVMFLVIRWNLKVGFLAAAVATLIILAFAGLYQAIICFVGFSFLGIFMGVLVKRGYGWVEIIGLGALVSLLSKLALVGLTLLLMGKNPIIESLNLMEQAFGQAYSMLGNLGEGLGENSVETLMRIVKMTIPAILILAALFDTFLNFVLGNWVGKRIGIRFPSFPAFSEWRLPPSMVWMYFLSWLLLFLGGSSFVYQIGLNLQLVTQILFMVQGVAILNFFLRKVIAQRVIRAIIIIFVVMQPVFSTVLAWLGVFDTWFDFRKLLKKK